MDKFFKYAFFGGISVSFDFLIYFLIYNYWLANPTVANIFGYILGTVLSFFLNAKLNFKVQDKISMRFFQFFMVGLVGLCVSTLFIYILTEYLKADYKLSKVLSLPLVLVLQFVLNKKLSFKKYE